jgi:SAM-dependent methyltransferase
MTDADGHFGESVAATYDDASDGEFDPAMIAETADLLAGLSAGKALELAIGTGRIALPLAGRGVEVHGIDLSAAMVARLRAKPGGDALPVTIGDITTTRVPGEFDLVYLLFNTIMNVTSQDGQVDCFRNAAAHLRPGGRFLIEVMLPDLRRLPPGQSLVPFQVSPRHFGVDRYEVSTQRMSSNYLTVDEDGHGRYASVPFRYVWPAELDLMARIAGLTPEHRWESWSRAPFTDESTRHISTWIKPG